MSQPTLAGFQPCSDVLLRELAELVDDSMLDEISKADYGEEAAEHLACLLRLRDGGEVPARGWIPQEVLELIRWSEPEDPAWKPGNTGRRGHIMRSFACAALLRIQGVPGEQDLSIGENQTVVQLLTSVEILGGSLPLATRRFLVWRLSESDHEDEERPYFIFALLLLSLSAHPRMAESETQDLLDWLLEDEQRLRQSGRTGPPGNADAWLLGLTWYDLRHEAWVRMIPRLLEFAAGVRSDRLQNDLVDVAQRLTPDPLGRWARNPDGSGNTE